MDNAEWRYEVDEDSGEVSLRAPDGDNVGPVDDEGVARRVVEVLNERRDDERVET